MSNTDTLAALALLGEKPISSWTKPTDNVRLHCKLGHEWGPVPLSAVAEGRARCSRCHRLATDSEEEARAVFIAEQLTGRIWESMRDENGDVAIYQAPYTVAPPVWHDAQTDALEDTAAAAPSSSRDGRTRCQRRARNRPHAAAP